MRRHVLFFGLLGGLLIAAVGIWLGRPLTRPRETVVVREVPVRVPARVARHHPPESGQNHPFG